MAVNSQTWVLFSNVLKLMNSKLDPARAPFKVLCLGYIDFLITRDDVASKYGQEIADRVTARADGQSIMAWHNSKSAMVIDAMSLFSALGYKVDFMDITASRGHEIVQDLNEPFPPQYVNAYDIVIDSGTMEHCFNAAQAIKNIAMALRVGGLVYHSNPLLMINHGFYNFSPTFYADFYAANGFKIVEMAALEITPEKLLFSPMVGLTRYQLTTPAERTMQVIGIKEAERPIVWPMQGKYAQNPNLRG